jgi:hypothetical protein
MLIILFNKTIVFYLKFITYLIFINFINNLLNSFILKFDDFYKDKYYKCNLEKVIKVLVKHYNCKNRLYKP